MYRGDTIPTMTPLMPVTSIGTMAHGMSSGMPYKPMTSFSVVSSLVEPVRQVVSHPVIPQPQRPVQGSSSGLTLKSPYSQQPQLQYPEKIHQHQQQQQQQHHHQQQQHHHQQQQHIQPQSSPSGSSPISIITSSPDLSDDLSTSSSSSSAGDMPGLTSGSGSSHLKKKGVPYIPSYMDLSNGPEPCVVCSDAATGYHYRCMTCEGCKGFFRRTIQKNLQYHCKWNKNCVIDKTTRNQCQECRFIKCLNVGMATDLVLNERQRTAKRKLIEDNRVRRKEELQTQKPLKIPAIDSDTLTDHDRGLICEVVTAYEYTAGKTQNSNKGEFDGVSTDLQSQDPDSWHQLAEAMTPSIIKVVEFAKSVPGFTELNVDDQILLLKSCCMEIMCLRAACRFDPVAETLTLHNGMKLHKSEIHQGGLAVLVEPIFDFAIGLAKLNLDKAEVALLAAVLLMQSDRSGLKESDNVERLQDAILGAFKRYVAENRPHQPVHWAKILMKVTDLRTISTRHAERVLCIRLDNSGEIPPLLLEVFNEGGQAVS